MQKIVPEIPLQRKGPITPATTPDNSLLNEQLKSSVAIIALLDEHSKLLREQVRLQEMQIPKGKTWPMSLTIPITAGHIVHLDFKNGERDARGVPTGSNIRYPYAKLFSLVIYNDGPATITFSTNGSPNSNESAATITSGNNTTIEFNYPVIETLNIALAATATQDAAIRLIGLS